MMDMHGEIAARVSAMRGERFTIDEEFDEVGEPTGIAIIRVTRTPYEVSIAFDIEEQEQAYVPPVLHELEEKLAGLRLLPYPNTAEVAP